MGVCYGGNVLMINNKYLRIERLNVFSHVWVFYEMDREVGSSDPDGEHFVTSYLFILGPDTPLQQILKRQVSSSYRITCEDFLLIFFRGAEIFSNGVFAASPLGGVMRRFEAGFVQEVGSVVSNIFCLRAASKPGSQ